MLVLSSDGQYCSTVLFVHGIIIFGPAHGQACSIPEHRVARGLNALRCTHGLVDGGMVFLGGRMPERSDLCTRGARRFADL